MQRHTGEGYDYYTHRYTREELEDKANVSIDKAAEWMEIPPRKLMKYLFDNNVVFRDARGVLRLTLEFRDNGMFIDYDMPIPGWHTRSKRILVTPEGRRILAGLLG